MGCKLSQDWVSATPAGINITGIISIKNRAACFTCSIFTIPFHKHSKSKSNPYTLAGTGKGNSSFNSSPIAQNKSKIINCFKNFTLHHLKNQIFPFGHQLIIALCAKGVNFQFQQKRTLCSKIFCTGFFYPRFIFLLFPNIQPCLF